MWMYYIQIPTVIWLALALWLLRLSSPAFYDLQVIVATNGILAEFIGDAILALWNCPHDVKLHGERCIEAAVGMHEKVEALQKQWGDEGHPHIGIRIGVHTSDVFVGNIGSRERMKYGVLGDGVNLASRLEELNKRYVTKVPALIYPLSFIRPSFQFQFIFEYSQFHHHNSSPSSVSLTFASL
jgi:hypothetical protein